MRKTYYIPTTEVEMLNTERMMGTATQSDHLNPAPRPRADKPF